MLAIASLAMSLLLKLIEAAARTKIGLFGIGGVAAAGGSVALGWAVCKIREFWHLSSVVCEDRKKGWFLFSWFTSSVVARSHETIISWLKMQSPALQKMYRDALVG